MDIGTVITWVIEMATAAGAARTREQRANLHRESWETVARKLGCSLSDARHSDRDPEQLQIVGHLDEITLCIDCYGQDSERAQWTRVRVIAPELRGVQVRVESEGVRAWIGRMLGGQDIVLGDFPFDLEFRVTSDAPARAYSWLDAELRRVLLACKGWRAIVADGEVVIERARFVTDVDELVRVAHAAVMFARAEHRFRARWQAAAHASGATGGPLRYEMQHGASRVSIDVDVRGERPIAHVRAELLVVSDDRLEIMAAGAPGTSEWPRVDLEDVLPTWQVHANDVLAVRRRLSGATGAALLALAPQRLVIDGKTITVALQGAEPNAGRLQGAVALAASLGQQVSVSPYR